MMSSLAFERYLGAGVHEGAASAKERMLSQIGFADTPFYGHFGGCHAATLAGCHSRSRMAATRTAFFDQDRFAMSLRRPPDFADRYMPGYIASGTTRPMRRRRHHRTQSAPSSTQADRQGSLRQFLSQIWEARAERHGIVMAPTLAPSGGWEALRRPRRYPPRNCGGVFLAGGTARLSEQMPDQAREFHCLHSPLLFGPLNRSIVVL